MTRRRSWASTMDPPYKPIAISGTTVNSPTRPTLKVDPVMSYTCRPTATVVRLAPMPDRNVPTHIRL